MVKVLPVALKKAADGQREKTLDQKAVYSKQYDSVCDIYFVLYEKLNNKMSSVRWLYWKCHMKI